MHAHAAQAVHLDFENRKPAPMREVGMSQLVEEDDENEAQPKPWRETPAAEQERDHGDAPVQTYGHAAPMSDGPQA